MLLTDTLVVIGMATASLGTIHEADHLDLGRMRVGETKERGVVVLHRDEDNRQERLTVRFTITDDMPKGLQHLPYSLETKMGDKTVPLNITIDVYIY